MKLTSKAWIIFISLCMGLFLVNFATYAQSFFGAGQKPSNPSSQNTPAIPPSRVLSPDEFNKIANQVSQQNTATLSKEAQQNIPKITPQQTPPTSKTSPASNPKPSSPTTPAASPTTTPNTDNSFTNSASTASPSAGQPAAAAPTPPANTQIYTGFGSSTQNNQKSGDSGASGSGNTSWRIQY